MSLFLKKLEKLVELTNKLGSLDAPIKSAVALIYKSLKCGKKIMICGEVESKLGLIS